MVLHVQTLLTQPVAFLGVSPGIPEMVVVFAAILLLFGSKNVPKIARSFGKAMEEFRRAAREVNEEIMHAADELPEPPPKGLPATTPREQLVAREIKEPDEDSAECSEPRSSSPDNREQASTDSDLNEGRPDHDGAARG